MTAPAVQAGDVVWTPPVDSMRTTAMGRFLTAARARSGRDLADYRDLHAWSVQDLPGFWRAVWDFFDLGGRDAPEAVLSGTALPDVRWFPGATLNYAREALRRTGSDVAVVARSDSRAPVELSWDELRDQVARARAGLQRLGVGRGDRVAAYLPTCPEAVVAYLATASLGAIWSSCAPEFGTESVVGRLSQIEPKVLLVIDAYRYGARTIERGDAVAEIRAGLPSVEATVVLPYLAGCASTIPDAIPWSDLVGQPAELEVDDVAFDHPLVIMYSSGTTGLPKPIVHGHGGLTLEHLKHLGLHTDLGEDDRFFWFSTTGWVMWNIVVSGLLLGSSIVLYDGDPGAPDLTNLWRLTADTSVTAFGVSAAFLLACRRAGIDDELRTFDLSALRSLGSTGSPLPAEGYDWVYRSLGLQVPLASISGGTDVASAFVGAAPLLPVYAGEIPCACLGCDVAALDDDGRPMIGRQGELVVRSPMPSMPVGLWGDADGSRLRAAYFDAHPGMWTHGDWITITERGSCIISGRSDATLNRGGVRLGTAEFYSVVEQLPEVADSLVVHCEVPGDPLGELLLFVVPAEGARLDDDLRGRIVTALRTRLSPRHAPDRIEAIAEVPRTLTGKKLEVPVKRLLLGEPIDVVANRGAVANPGALDALAAFVRAPQPVT